MKPPSWPVQRLMRLLVVLLAVAVVLPGGLALAPAAHAQEARERQGVGLLRFLFPRREEKKQERVAPPKQTQQRRPAASARRAQPPAAPVEPAIEKAEDARRILIVGDFMASGLAEGLTAAYAQNPNVVVIDRANGSSGLVRDDHYDWLANIGPVIDDVKPVAVLVMIGSNDRQQMVVSGTREQPRSEGWTAEYERRAAVLAKAIRDRDLPLLWVGNLPFRSPAMSSDMIAFNDIYRRLATEAGGEFIDVWDGFVDETGSFAAAGPDMNGQPAQLRASDGINVTRQGRRKIAFYAEKPLARLLGAGADQPGVDGPGDTKLPGAETGPGAPAVIDRTPPMAIEDIGADGGATLLGAQFTPRNGEARTPAERLTREGIASTPQPGRADNFSARRSKPVASETTSALP